MENNFSEFIIRVLEIETVKEIFQKPEIYPGRWFIIPLHFLYITYVVILVVIIIFNTFLLLFKLF